MATVNAVHEICKEWKSSMPKLMKSKNTYEIYIHSEQNTRRRMEDKHIVLTEFNNLFGLDKVSSAKKTEIFLNCFSGYFLQAHFILLQ